MNRGKAGRLGKQFRMDLSVSLGLSVVAVFFFISGIISYVNIQTLNRDSEQIAHTHEVLLGLNNVLSTMKDAETGQRGYVITGQESYLDPYNEALAGIDEQVQRIEQLTRDNPDQQRRITPLRSHIDAKLQELSTVIEMRRSEGMQAAMARVATNRGKEDMDAIRAQVALMQATETNLRQARVAEMDAAYDTAVVSIAVTALIGVLLSIAITVMISRASAARRKEEWLQAGQVGLSAAMMGEQRLDQLGHSILTFLSEYAHASASAFYALTDGAYKRSATVGVPDQNAVPVTFGARDGLLGQAVSEGKAIMLRDLPATDENHHLSVGAALGQWRPRHLLVAPAKAERRVDAVIELGFVEPVSDLTLDLMARVSESISIAVQTANYRANLQNLLEETQRQSEELQSQGEELRVNNEELEEQGRALKESHFRLEQQQAELEQTNSQLEEQTAALERQKEDLARSTREIEAKAHELEQASRYKSDFLANMSHELRTPLNSSLILAKLLGDNPDGNLTEEQVKFAQTIQSSGNDLLALINDILDLSKIEAGQMEIRAESLSLARLVKDGLVDWRDAQARAAHAEEFEQLAPRPSL